MPPAKYLEGEANGVWRQQRCNTAIVSAAQEERHAALLQFRACQPCQQRCISAWVRGGVPPKYHLQDG